MSGAIGRTLAEISINNKVFPLNVTIGCRTPTKEVNMSLLSLYQPFSRHSNFEKLFGDLTLNDYWVDNTHLRLGIKLNKCEDGVMLHLPLPGYNDDDLSIHVEDGYLTVEATSDCNPLGKEFNFSYKLNDYVVEEESALLKNGVLS